jgi:hypothetical protein
VRRRYGSTEEALAAKKLRKRLQWEKNKTKYAANRRAKYASIKDEANAARRAEYASNPEPIKRRQAEWITSNGGQAWLMRYNATGKPKQKDERYRTSPDGKTKIRAKVERYVRERDWLKRLADNHRIKKYGLKRGQFEEMLAARGGRCDICAEVIVNRPCLDHCHRTGSVRGILCNACNSALGSFRDSPDLLRAAIAYLKRHAEAECA